MSFLKGTNKTHILQLTVSQNKFLRGISTLSFNVWIFLTSVLQIEKKNLDIIIIIF